MKKWQKILLTCCAFIFSLVLTAIISLFLILEPNVKISGFAEMDKNILENINNNIVFIDDCGEVIKDTIGVKGSNYYSYEDIPKPLIEAFVSIEDKRFFSHHGIDYMRIFGALFNNIRKGKIAEGASTITQQLVKNTHLTADKTLKRKIQEIRIAKQIERKYTKEDIMEMYLNILYFGNNIYGIGNAAELYFGHKPEELSLSQCAALAAIINNPAKYNPYLNIPNLEERKKTVLKRMRDLKYINDTEYKEAINEKTEVISSNSINNHFFEFAYNEIQEKTGRKENNFTSPILVKTTLNKSFQQKIEKVLQESLPNNNVMAQAILLENSTGKVLAYAASDKFGYLDLRRQLGSTIKPIICYAPCLEKKLIYTCSPILDEPMVFENDFRPKNYKDNYMGWISAEKALIHSSNICAVKFLEMAGIDYGKRLAEKAGLVFDVEDKELVLALGATHNGNRLIEIANVYQMFGNSGIFLPCTFIEEIRKADGKLLYNFAKKEKAVIDKGNAYLINSMLKKCVKSGTAKKLKDCPYAVAAKTGTVGTKDGNTDAYCITYGQDYTLAVWFGAKEGRMANSISGGTLPAITARNILNSLQLDMKDFVMPDNIVELKIDKQEYEQNHKVILTNGVIAPRELMSCLFHKENIPKERSKKNVSEYILNMDKLNFDNLNIA